MPRTSSDSATRPKTLGHRTPVPLMLRNGGCATKNVWYVRPAGLKEPEAPKDHHLWMVHLYMTRLAINPCGMAGLPNTPGPPPFVAAPRLRILVMLYFPFFLH